MEFNKNGLEQEDVMICYFWQAVKTLLSVEIERYDWELKSFNKIVEKTVEGKAKAAFRVWFYSNETNQSYLRGSHLTTSKYYT